MRAGKAGSVFLENVRNLSLFRKVLLLFSIILFVSIGLLSLFFWGKYQQLIDAEMRGIAQRNTNLIAGNIDTMIDTASYNSRILLANDTVQRLLKEKADFGSVSTLREFQNAFRAFMTITPHISATYVFDTNGHNYGVDNYSYQTFSFSRIDLASWYPSVLAGQGFYVMLVNSGEERKLNGDENVITLIRSVYDLDEASRLLGTIMLNMKESLFTNCFSSMTESGELYATVVDENFRPVLSGGADFLSMLDRDGVRGLVSHRNSNPIVETRTGTMIFSGQKLKNAGWYVVTAVPYAEGSSQFSGLDTIYWLFILFIVALVFFAATIINRFFIAPIRQLTAMMQCVGHGEFMKAEMRTGNDEIGLLKNTYNSMIDRIQSLMVDIKNEGDRKRIAELHSLQMQIKPHFLYNTIDTARSLVLSGHAQEVNTLLRSLGQFYRNSICGGKDVITLDEEIDMVRNYLVIQKMRYGDLFEVEYEIDESLLKMPMLKLVIQPLVENAIYHGIRPSGRNGIISLRVWRETSLLCISVSDNGVGMSAEKLADVMNACRDVRMGEYIGLCGTIDRLRLFCGIENPLRISSDPGFGTRVTVFIPEEVF
jgi:two-component system sensor histidine kinase YesM